MHQDQWITDFQDLYFQAAFRSYFRELQINVRDWAGLFGEMNCDPHGQNFAWLRREGERPVGFILYSLLPLKSWFFSAQIGFVREFWVAPAYRSQGHGSALLKQAEADFRSKGCGYAILTTDSAEGFYRSRGYEPQPSITAVNDDTVFLKKL